MLGDASIYPLFDSFRIDPTLPDYAQEDGLLTRVLVRTGHRSHDPAVISFGQLVEPTGRHYQTYLSTFHRSHLAHWINRERSPNEYDAVETEVQTPEGLTVPFLDLRPLNPPASLIQRAQIISRVTIDDLPRPAFSDEPAEEIDVSDPGRFVQDNGFQTVEVFCPVGYVARYYLCRRWIDHSEVPLVHRLVTCRVVAAEGAAPVTTPVIRAAFVAAGLGTDADARRSTSHCICCFQRQVIIVPEDLDDACQIDGLQQQFATRLATRLRQVFEREPFYNEWGIVPHLSYLNLESDEPPYRQPSGEPQSPDGSAPSSPDSREP